MLEECVKGNYNVRFHTHSYHCCREMHFISRLDVKFSCTLFHDWTLILKDSMEHEM